MPSEEASRRLSLSELVSKNDIKPPQFKLPLSVFSAPVPTAAPSAKARHSDSSTSTTPPNSPPRSRPTTKDVIPPRPVFTAPEPVFKAPAPKPKPHPYPFGGSAFTIGLQPQFPKHSTSPKPATALYKESSQDSLFSDAIFDSQPGGSGGGHAWAPSTQDTEYTQQDAQSQALPKMIIERHFERDDIDEDPDDLNLNDDDDSWPLSEKLAAARQVWAGQEDSMTWSSVPTDSQNGDTRHMGFTQSLSQHREVEGEEAYEEQREGEKVNSSAMDASKSQPDPAPVAMDVDVHEEFEEGVIMSDMEDDADGEDEDFEDIVMKGKPTVQLVKVSFSLMLIIAEYIFSRDSAAQE